MSVKGEKSGVAPETDVSDRKSADAWLDLRRHTAARIALGRTGTSLPLREQLRFELAHAQARDAVHIPLDTSVLRAELERDLWHVAQVCSRAADRNMYLARPDWGRRLHPDCAQSLASDGPSEPELVFVISDGLSSTAVQRHAAALMREIRQRLPDPDRTSVVIAVQARVALADEVGGILGAQIAVSVIGERPGLSSPDSLGLYLTHTPRIGRSDAERNCISNVRPQGLGYAEAADQLLALIHASRRAGLSGVRLRPDGALSDLSAPQST